MSDLFLLIDGNSLINRAFYALPPMHNRDGVPTQAVYGFVAMLFKAIDDYKPNRLAVAFDLPAPTFRHLAFRDYKANRKGMPDELAVQLPLLKQLLRDMNLRIFEKPSFEADDIIGTLSNCNTNTIIITGDRDAFQLIDEKTRVGFTKKGISQLDLFDEAKLVDEYGLTPRQIIDFKAISGDKSDNIPGVAGIGDKGALNLLQTFGSIEGIYEHIEELRGAVKERLISGKESAFLSKHLATIDRNVPLDFCDVDCGFSLPFPFAARQRLVDYGINSIANRAGIFSLSDESDVKQPSLNLPKIEEISSLDGLKIDGDCAVFMDTEQLLIATRTVQYQVRITQNLIDAGITEDKICLFLAPILADKSIFKAIFDSKALAKRLNCPINNCFDLRLATHIMGLKAETEQDFCNLFGYDYSYAAYAFLNESANLEQKLRERDLQKLYEEIELPLIKVLQKMEKSGFKLDMELNSALNEEFNARCAAIVAEIYELSGEEFNVNSPKQLAKILFEKLQIPYPKRSKTLSTAHEILAPLAPNYPIVEKVLNYRQLAKLNSTYIEGFKRLADKNGVVHTEFKQTLTTTGRLSSIEPNLQNIPVREEEGRRIRGLFVAKEGYSLLCADYSQIELRLLAHFSRDEVMCDAFNSGRDIHGETAARIFGVNNSTTRHQAKAVNFGIIYGISDYGLSEQLHIPPSKARQIIRQYFEKFPSIRAYLDESVAIAQKRGYSTTIFNRVRMLPELNSPNQTVKKFGERAAMNMPLQGSAADIIKAAMIEVDRRLEGLNARLILQVHDELIVEAEDSIVGKVAEILTDCMENITKLNVPLRVSIATGKRWSECKG